MGNEDYYRAFWDRFLRRVHQEHPDWTRATKSKKEFLAMPSPIRGTKIGASFTREHLRHDLYINGGDRERNLEVFNALEKQRVALEEAYGRPLKFEKELPRSPKACRIADYRPGDVTDTESYDELIGWLLDAGTRLREALSRIQLPSSGEEADMLVRHPQNNSDPIMKPDNRLSGYLVDADFTATYRNLEARMKALAEADGDVFEPTPEPSGPVDYVFVCMEPSLGGHSAAEVRADVEAGGRNFVNGIKVQMLHFAIRQYLCKPNQRYHITDISKGGMPTERAEIGRKQRWDRWYPLLVEELNLVAKPGARMFAVGREVEKYLKDRGWPVTYVLHYSARPDALDACIDRYKDGSKRFERFKSSVSRQDVLASAREVLTASVPPWYRDATLKRLAGPELTEYQKKLIFCYKLAFERQT